MVVKKCVLFYLIMFVLMLIMVELASYSAIYIFNSSAAEPIRKRADIYAEQSVKIQNRLRMEKTSMLVHDAILGWRYRPGYTSEADTINSMGLRSDWEYESNPRAGTLRVAAFGGSFVYCNEVKNSDSWPAILENAYAEIEILNYGVGGYGTDQALMRYRIEGNALSPNVVIIGFAPVDLRRVVNVYRRFVSTREIPLTKPRFVLNDNHELVVLTNPVSTLDDWSRFLDEPSSIVELGVHDQWYQSTVYENPLYDVFATIRIVNRIWIILFNRYIDSDRLFQDGVFSETSSAFELQMAIIEEFASVVVESGAIPIVLILPGKQSVFDSIANRSRVYDPLLEELRNTGIETLDAGEAFAAAGTDTEPNSWFMEGGHYSPSGNTIVGLWVGKEIKARVRSINH